MKAMYHMVICLVFFILGGCQNDYNDILQKRNTYASTNPVEIVVTVIVPGEKQHFAKNYIKGIELAVKEINSNTALLANKKILLNFVDDKDSFDSMESEIFKVISNPKVVAVLGHTTSKNAIPASIVYGKAGIIFIPSFATAAALGGSGRPEHIFKMLPDNTTQVDQIINFTKLQGSEKVALLSAQDKYNKDLSILFSSRAEDQKLTLVEEIFFPPKEMNFNYYVENLKKTLFDSIVISSSTEQAVSLVSEIRRAGIYSPIILTDSIDKDSFLEKADKDTQDIITVSSYHMNIDSINNKNFIESYAGEFKEDPDDAAVIGYDSIMLLAYAINKSGSTHMKSISSTLHNMPAWPGIKSIYKFDQFGNVRGKKYHFEILVDNHWHKISYSEKSYNNYLLKKSMKFEGSLFFKEKADWIWKDYKEKYNYELLKLSQRIFKFNSLGLTYIDDVKGRSKTQVENIERLAKELKFKLIACKVPSFLRKNITLLEEFIQTCYEEISLLSEVVFFSPSRALAIDYYTPIIDMLEKVNVPVFSVNARDEVKPLTVISLNRSELILDEFEAEKILPRIMSNSTIYDFYNYVKYVPEVSVNFEKYKKYNLNESIILDLSPVRPIRIAVEN